MYALRDSSGETRRQAASGRQVETEDLRRASRDAAEALRLAVAEDRAEVARRAFGGGERLGEEDGALGVVAARVVDEGDGDVLGVVVAGALQLGDELGPGGADDQRLEAGVPGGVLLVHREHGEVLDAVATVLLGAEGLGGAHEVGLGEPGVRPGAEVVAERADVVVLVGEVGREALRGVGDRAGEVLGAGGVVLRGVDRAVGLLHRAQLLDGLLELGPGGVGLGGRVGEGVDAAERGLRGPVHEVEPQRLVVELADAVVAEQVGVGEDGDVPVAVPGDRGEGCAGRAGGVRGAGEHAGAVGERERAGAVEAGAVHAGEEVDVGVAVLAAVELGEHPRGGVVVVLVVLDRAVLDADAEPREQVVEVVAVLVLLGLAEDDQAAARADELVDRVELVVGEPWRAAVGRGLPPRVGGVGDDEDVGFAEGLGERAVDVRGDGEVVRGERRGGASVGGVLGVGRLHARGLVGARGPRLAVGLVEEHSGSFWRHRIRHIPVQKLGPPEAAVNVCLG